MGGCVGKVTWLLWPIVVLMTVLVQAGRRVLRRWRLLLLWFGLSFPCWFLIQPIVWVFTPDKIFSRLEAFHFTVLWWHRIRSLWVARVLPDGWTHRPPVIWGWKLGDPYIARGNPTITDILGGYFHVALAASLTLTVAVMAVLFIRAIVASFAASIEPFTSEIGP